MTLHSGGVSSTGAAVGGGINGAGGAAGGTQRPTTTISIGNDYAQPSLLFGPNGEVVFSVPDFGEVLRFEVGGKVTVRGEVIDDNKTVYEAFLEWMRDLGLAVPVFHSAEIRS